MSGVELSKGLLASCRGCRLRYLCVVNVVIPAQAGIQMSLDRSHCSSSGVLGLSAGSSPELVEGSLARVSAARPGKDFSKKLRRTVDIVQFCPIFVLPAKTRVEAADEEAQEQSSIRLLVKLFGAKLFDSSEVMTCAGIDPWLINRPVNDESDSRASYLVTKGQNSFGEFDPGSERTLTVCLIHASRAESFGAQRRTGA